MGKVVSTSKLDYNWFLLNDACHL